VSEVALLDGVFGFLEERSFFVLGSGVLLLRVAACH
jgi:hypothetical protein